MERKKRASKKICSIEITPHLAEYARKKYHASSADGSIRIPSTSDLYHCVWHHMQRPPSVPMSKASASGQSSPGILLISLPSRRPSSTDGPWKDPAYFNYLSSEAARSIEACLRREFNFEFHRAMMENEERGRPRRNIDVVEDFMRQYHLKSITSDALLKNYYRYRDLVRPKQRRRYSQRKPRP